MQFSGEDYLIVCVFVVVSAVLTFLSILSTTSEVVRNNSDRTTLSYTIIPISLVGAVFGFCFLKFNIKRAVLLTLIGVFCMIPFIIGLAVHLSSGLEVEVFLGLSIPPAWFLFFLLLKTLNYGYSLLGVPLGTLIIGAYCVLIPIFVIGIPLYLALISESISQDYWVETSYIVGIPVIISIVLPWTCLLYTSDAADE